MISLEVLHDDLAVSPVRSAAAADQYAREARVDVTRSLITITQRASGDGAHWQINDGPQEYVGRRGGDLRVEVEGRDASIAPVLHGQ